MRASWWRLPRRSVQRAAARRRVRPAAASRPRHPAPPEACLHRRCPRPRPYGTDARDDDERHAGHLEPGQRLPEDQVPGQGGGGRRQAHQDGEGCRREAPQGHELERVGNRRRQQGDRCSQAEDLRAQQCVAGVQDAEGKRDHRPDHHGECEPVQLLERPAHTRGGEDVEGPACCRAECEEHADGVEAIPATTAEGHHAEQGEPGPQPGRAGTRDDDRQRERPQHLDRDRDAEREPLEGQVEQPVHEGEHGAESQHGDPPRAPVAAQRGARDGHQHDRREHQSEQHHAERPDRREEKDGDGRAHLLTREADDDQGDRETGSPAHRAAGSDRESRLTGPAEGRPPPR